MESDRNLPVLAAPTNMRRFLIIFFQMVVAAVVIMVVVETTVVAATVPTTRTSSCWLVFGVWRRVRFSVVCVLMRFLRPFLDFDLLLQHRRWWWL